MPKRRRRGSGWSSASNRSPRKSNPNVAATENDGDEEAKVEMVTFSFLDEEGDTDEMLVNPFLMLTVSCAGEEHEDENQKPEEKVVTRSHTMLSNASPSKRASPLSPTLFDNVPQKLSQTPGEISPVESDPAAVVPLLTPKTEEKHSSTFTSARQSKKRRRICSGAMSEVKVEDVLSSTKGSRQPTRRLIDVPSHSKVPYGEPSDKVALPVANFRILEDYKIEEVPTTPEQYRKCIVKTKKELCRDVIYELDEVDVMWLEAINEIRTELLDGIKVDDVQPEEMELLLDRFEKEYYYELMKSGLGQPLESDEDAVCCICLDGESDNSNQIIFCDMCNIPVHQDCFGVPYIPEGSWLCRKCTACPDEKIECIFCPNTNGAFKKTVDGRWAHVLCALWIPEVRFSNPTFLEPVDDIDDIPPARWRLVCYICKKKGVGACIQCHLRSCVTAFHVTCAQAEGLSLKIETKESGEVGLRASCDKHTRVEDKESLKQKIETINKVLDEKRATSSESSFPTISANRILAISELVSFPGKHVFIRRLLAFWKIKRKDRGGAPLLRDLESMWIQNKEAPPAPPPQPERKYDPVIMQQSFEKMQMLRSGLSTLKSYCALIKQHSEAQMEDRSLKFKAKTIRMKAFDLNGMDVYMHVVDQLAAKDKHATFAEPVTIDDAPEYFDVISNPMDLSTMRNKIMQLEYSSLQDLEVDFDLMITNCMTYNKKSTPYYRDAVRLKEFSLQVFEDARVALEQRSKAAKNKPDTCNIDLPEEAPKYPPSQGVLNSIIDELAGHDKNGVFAEPVDVNVTPDYLTIIAQPMDFSTMKEKINSNQYSRIEELESDYFLMINNCFQYNDEKSRFYKLATKMNGIGKSVFQEAKQKIYMQESVPPVVSNILSENNNNYKTETLELEELTEEKLFSIMSEVMKKLSTSDDEKIFMEPVTEEDAPGYFEIIKEPMDLSLIEKNLNSSKYTTLEEMERDFSVMIENCKKYNTVGTKYFNYATKIKRAGNSAFNAARKRLAAFKNPNECAEKCDD